MKNSKFILFIIILNIFFISSCIPNTLIFSGESENWSIQYEVEKDGNTSSSKGYIKYIGEDRIPKDIEFSIAEKSGKVELDEVGVFILPESTCGENCATEHGHSEIEAVIKWNNRTETLPLILN